MADIIRRLPHLDWIIDNVTGNVIGAIGPNQVKQYFNPTTTAGGTETFSALNVSGVITSTQTTGTAPFVVASTTNVANLNASSLSGATFASPGAIGATTPASGAFTTLNANSTITATTSNAFTARSGASGTSMYISLGRNSEDSRITVASATNDGVTGAVAGDTIINTQANGWLGRQGSPLLQWSGTGVAVTGTLSATGAATFSPANSAVTLSPTGTGVVTINPATTGAMDNVAMGVATRANAQFNIPINNQTGTTYTLVQTDFGKIVTFNNASAITVTLPQQSTLTTVAGVNARLRNIGAGLVTLVKEGSETLVGNTTIATNAELFLERTTTTNWATSGGTAVVTDGFGQLIQVVANNTYNIKYYPNYSGTITAVAEKCRALTTAGTFAISIAGVNVTGLTSVVPTTAGSTTSASAANTFVAGNPITITYSGTTGVLDHDVDILVTRTY
jgi:hypothetical protein